MSQEFRTFMSDKTIITLRASDDLFPCFYIEYAEFESTFIDEFEITHPTRWAEMHHDQISAFYNFEKYKRQIIKCDS